MTDVPLNHETFAIVPVFNGKPPSDAIMHGSLSEILEHVGQTQARVAVEQRIAEAKEQIQADAKTLQNAQHITARAATRITAIGDALVAAKEKQARRDAKAKKDAEEAAEAKRVQEMLDRLPDPDAVPDDGDLQSPKRPTDKEHLNPTGEDGITGSFPTRLEKEAPRGGPYQEPDIKDLDHPQKPQQQPAAISLNME